MLQSDSLPLADVLDCQQWRDIFEAHKISFGQDDDSVYTPAVTLWALISQVFFKGELRSSKEQKKVSGLFFGLLWSVSIVVVEL